VDRVEVAGELGERKPGICRQVLARTSCAVSGTRGFSFLSDLFWSDAFAPSRSGTTAVSSMRSASGTLDVPVIARWRSTARAAVVLDRLEPGAHLQRLAVGDRRQHVDLDSRR